jgi:hypothetical protein
VVVRSPQLLDRAWLAADLALSKKLTKSGHDLHTRCVIRTAGRCRRYTALQTPYTQNRASTSLAAAHAIKNSSNRLLNCVSDENRRAEALRCGWEADGRCNKRLHLLLEVFFYVTHLNLPTAVCSQVHSSLPLHLYISWRFPHQATMGRTGRRADLNNLALKQLIPVTVEDPADTPII